MGISPATTPIGMGESLPPPQPLYQQQPQARPASCPMTPPLSFVPPSPLCAHLYGHFTCRATAQHEGIIALAATKVPAAAPCDPPNHPAPNCTACPIPMCVLHTSLCIPVWPSHLSQHRSTWGSHYSNL
jgi:hypothetical protein